MSGNNHATRRIARRKSASRRSTGAPSNSSSNPSSSNRRPSNQGSASFSFELNNWRYLFFWPIDLLCIAAGLYFWRICLKNMRGNPRDDYWYYFYEYLYSLHKELTPDWITDANIENPLHYFLIFVIMPKCFLCTFILRDTRDYPLSGFTNTRCLGYVIERGFVVMKFVFILSTFLLFLPYTLLFAFLGLLGAGGSGGSSSGGGGSPPSAGSGSYSSGSGSSQADSSSFSGGK